MSTELSNGLTFADSSKTYLCFSNLFSVLKDVTFVGHMIKLCPQSSTNLW
jgi:hypothetical protein